MTDFTYPINTASKTAQRLFDIVRPPSLALHHQLKPVPLHGKLQVLICPSVISLTATVVE